MNRKLTFNILSHIESSLMILNCENCEKNSAKIDQIEREIELIGNLSAEQRERLLEIADKCPVHRTLHNDVKVVTKLI